MSTRANKRRINQRFYGRFRANFFCFEAQHFSFNRSTSAEQDGLPMKIKNAALDNPELPLSFVRDIIVSREEVKSGQVLIGYELDDGH